LIAVAYGHVRSQARPGGDPGFKVLVEAAKSGRAHVMLSASHRTGPEGARVAARILLAAYGPDRLLWDSDWPHPNTELDRTTTYLKMLQSLAEWVPDAATRRKILQDTPTRLFGFA
jgi:predicted TIM-barrel fold metal-dependent hydrolase